MVILKTRGALSSVSLATERAAPQEIPLHTILLFFKLFKLRYFYCNFTYCNSCCYFLFQIICMWNFKINEVNWTFKKFQLPLIKQRNSRWQMCTYTWDAIWKTKKTTSITITEKPAQRLKSVANGNGFFLFHHLINQWQQVLPTRLRIWEKHLCTWNDEYSWL